MDILLAAFLMLMGQYSAGEANQQLALEQLMQASLDAKQAIVEQQEVMASMSIDLGDLFPLGKKDPQPEAPVVKGIYSTAYTAGGSRMESLLQLIEETELNSIVIDIKDDEGYITFDTGNEELTELGTTYRIIRNMNQLMEQLNEKDIYPIARIVVFKDTIWANKHPELSFLNSDGTVWTNNRTTPESFVNPYRQEVWDYNIAVAKEAAKAGFKEIQFDYVRFPEGFETRADQLTYDQDERSRVQVISEFVKYAREQLAPLDIRVSVDIFGYAASAPAEGIGQDFQQISANVDVISPMIYPSHYSTGWFGAKVPDAEPYRTIHGASVDTNKKLEAIGLLKPIVRPWIQDFTATWIKGYIPYGKREVEEQIRALRDNGIEEYLLWNPVNRYSSGVEY